MLSPFTSREAGRMSACAKEQNRATKLFHSEVALITSREAGRMSACAKEQNRATKLFHI
jgi:hypothetical protein